MPTANYTEKPAEYSERRVIRSGNLVVSAPLADLFTEDGVLKDCWAEMTYFRCIPKHYNFCPTTYLEGDS